MTKAENRENGVSVTSGARLAVSVLLVFTILFLISLTSCMMVGNRPNNWKDFCDLDMHDYGVWGMVKEKTTVYHGEWLYQLRHCDWCNVAQQQTVKTRK